MLRITQILIRRCQVLIGGLWLFASALEAAEIRRFTTDDGLLDNRVLSITQTFDGFLWLATPAGLARFDGRGWQAYDRRSHPTLVDEHITRLAADRLGYLWVGTEGGGLHRFDGLQFRPVSRPNQIGGPWQVTALRQEPDSTLWIGTPNDLLYLEASANSSKHGLPGVRVTDLTQDLYGHVWASAGRGLFRKVHSTFQAITLPLGLGTTLIQTLVMTPEGDLVLGRQDGLLRLGGDFESTGLPQTFEYAEPFRDRPVTALTVDRRGRLIAATADQVGRFEAGGELTTLLGGPGAPAGAGLEAGAVTTVFEDREGSLWVGTDGGGLYQLTESGQSPSLAAQVAAVELDGVAITPRPRLVLQPTLDEVAIEVSAPTFLPRTSIHFRHRLEGLEQDWQLGDGGWVRYRNLAPRTYVFKAEVSSDGEAWTGATELTLVRQPRLHQTTRFWIYVLGSTFALGLTGAGWLWHQRRRAAFFEEMRAREWQEMHEESGFMDAGDSSPDDPR